MSPDLALAATIAFAAGMLFAYGIVQPRLNRLRELESRTVEPIVSEIGGVRFNHSHLALVQAARLERTLGEERVVVK